MCVGKALSHNCYCYPVLVTRRVTDLLDDGSILLCEQLIGAIPIGHRSRPLPRGGLAGGVAFLGATGETDGTLPSTRAHNLA
eukprot:3899256-Pyramimonas_sp.AAC.1